MYEVCRDPDGRWGATFVGRANHKHCAHKLVWSCQRYCYRRLWTFCTSRFTTAMQCGARCMVANTVLPFRELWNRPTLPDPISNNEDQEELDHVCGLCICPNAPLSQWGSRKTTTEAVKQKNFSSCFLNAKIRGECAWNEAMRRMLDRKSVV